MATDEQVQRALLILSDFVECPVCETRIRFGDMECPHCGEDLDDLLRQWAERLLDVVDGR